MKNDDKVIVGIYLDSLGSTLWGKAHEINSPEGKIAAIDFIYEMWESLEQIAANKLKEEAHGYRD